MPKITPQLVTKAVKAFVRHKYTDYDEQLMTKHIGHARRNIRPAIKAKLGSFRGV